MNEKLNLIKADGTQIQTNLICFIENTTNNKHYLYHTLNETVGDSTNGTVKIYVDKIKQNDPILDAPITTEEWDVLKGYMGDALKGTPNATLKYLAVGNTNLESVSQMAIAMPLSYDYINKQKGLYAEAIATADMAVAPSEPEPTPVEAPIAPEVLAPSEPVVEEPEIAPEAAPSIEQVEVTEPVQEEPTPVEDVSAIVEEAPVAEEATQMAQPINIDEIETKYAEMIKDIEALKAKEIEAAKRYNATIELSAMHNEQHASYVQSEQADLDKTQPIFKNEPLTDVTPEEPSLGFIEPNMTNPEPVAITPVVPEPSPVQPEALETNWFDMPVSE